MPNIEALRQVVRVLRAVPDDKFNMAVWKDKDPRCGTVACAIGWAAQDPWFIERGLEVELDNDDLEFEPTYMGLMGWDAIESFFQLTEYQAEHLFYGYRYFKGERIVAADVVMRLNAFILEHSYAQH